MHISHFIWFSLPSHSPFIVTSFALQHIYAFLFHTFHLQISLVRNVSGRMNELFSSSKNKNVGVITTCNIHLWSSESVKISTSSLNTQRIVLWSPFVQMYMYLFILANVLRSSECIQYFIGISSLGGKRFQFVWNKYIKISFCRQQIHLLMQM